MIFVDEVRRYPGMGLWCHMWTDGGDAELDTFATALGLKLSWSHTSEGYSGRFYHYDLRPSKRDLALKRGAIFKPLAQHIQEQGHAAGMWTRRPKEES